MIQIVRPNLNDIAQEHCDSVKLQIDRKLKGKGGALYSFIKANLELILKGNPQLLQTEIIDKIPPVGNRKSKKYTELKNVFDYNGFIRSSKYGAYALAKKLDVKTCPYCNRSYTFTLDTKTGRTRPEFDHFFDQATYPYLALSFYNLIPSCHICNSNLKGTSAFSTSSHLNPYIEGFDDDVKFNVVLKIKKALSLKEIENDYGLGFFYGSLDSFDLKLKINNPLNEKQKRANANIEIFKLEELYTEHKDYVAEIVQKTIVYSDVYVKELIKSYPLIFRDDDVRRMLFSNYIDEDNLDKRVLSKLTKDIFDEFKIR